MIFVFEYSEKKRKMRLTSLAIAWCTLCGCCICWRKLTTITVPEKHCPLGVYDNVWDMLFEQRKVAERGWPTLFNGLRWLTETAEQRAADHLNGPFLRPGFATVGEFTILLKQQQGSDKSVMDLSKLDINQTWTEFNRRRPWYQGDSAAGRRFEEAEWRLTRWFGVHCNTWPVPAEGVNVFFMVVHFLYPKELARATVGSSVCPPTLLSATANAFNDARKASGLNPLTISAEMTASAAQAAAERPPNNASLANKPNFAQASQYGIAKEEADSSEAHSDSEGGKYISLRGLDILGNGARLSSDGRPWYTGDSGGQGRFLGADEWARTSQMGMGCVANSIGGGRSRFILMVHFKYPGR